MTGARLPSVGCGGSGVGGFRGWCGGGGGDGQQEYRLPKRPHDVRVSGQRVFSAGLLLSVSGKTERYRGVATTAPGTM